MEMSSLKETHASKSDLGKGLKHCQACAVEANVDELSRCKGCESVWYCDKVCEAMTGLRVESRLIETIELSG